MENVLLTLVVGLSCALLLKRFKIPGGMLVGAIIGVACLNITTGLASMPYWAKLVAQITAGAYIGNTLKNNDLPKLKILVKPALLVMCAFLVLNVIVGFVIYLTNPIDLTTALMCAVPGGVSDIPLIAADMNADVTKVMVLQFVRLVCGVGVFPQVINLINRQSDVKKHKEDAKANNSSLSEENASTDYGSLSEKSTTNVNKSLPGFLATATVAICCGLLGKSIGLPAGALVFSMISIIAYNMITGKAYIPNEVRRLAQVLSGAYIGCGMEYKDILELKYLILPILFY
ncbi:MAG: AbrB family transcriptional regulator [Clostridia bacterium]